MRKYVSFFVSLLTVLLVVTLVWPAVAADDGLDKAVEGLNSTAGAAGLTGYGNSVPAIAGNIIGTLLSMISVLFFVLVLYGGILWMTARGNAETTGKALNTIIAATIGIIIIMGAYALTNFVFKLGGSTGGTTNDTTTGGPTMSCIADAGYCAPFDENSCDTNFCVYLDMDADSDGQNEGCVPMVQTACTNLPQQQCTTLNQCIWGTGDNAAS